MKPPMAPKSEMHIAQILPNLLTLAAICAGLTAIRFGVEGHFERSVQLILLAGVLDGLDGRLARLLKSESQIGAELDSLADFVNFGVAPMLLIYLWGLQDTRNEAWIAMLVFSMCCVIRLARFNVGARAGADAGESVKEKKADFFTGIPSPAGAVLALLPMYLYFLWGSAPDSLLADAAICVWVVFVGLMMISRIPTFALKKMTIARARVRWFMVAFVFYLAALLTYTWLTLALSSLLYLALIPVGIRAARKPAAVLPEPQSDEG